MLCSGLARLSVLQDKPVFVRLLVGATSLPSQPSEYLRQEGPVAGKMAARPRPKVVGAAANGAGGTGARLAEELVGEVEEHVEGLEKRTGWVWWGWTMSMA